jgi:FMN hydrolase / 5-amino-6-(5-phospho-D-ribitylamino)uracil phosphatase
VSVRAITIDFWGTLLFDPPSSDNRYKGRRLRDFENILAGAGVRVSSAALDRAYESSAVYLSRIWAKHRDVPVIEHVRAIVGAVDSGLPGRLPSDVLAALVDAYAAPVLLVPPAVDDGALKALSALREEGYTLAVVSNTMRTPGAALRKLLEKFGLLRYFAHTVFSDEVGVRKPDPAIFLGARAAGMRVIQVTSASLAALGGRRPDAVIPSLGTLPDAVARLGT